MYLKYHIVSVFNINPVTYQELIQNADDAGASRVVFIHDERHYETQSLWTEELGKYQGPALYAFNDAAFTEEDWEGIQRVGRSIKQDDPTKVGRFGIGFNSVYHITDLPCVFSSEHLAIFDPQKKVFGDDEEGYRWSLDDEEDRESLLNLRDQFQPFQNVVSHVISCSWEKVISEEQYFKGTLFRFPLRNEASEISDNLYDSTKVTQLFDSFIADADISLLFLRNVSSITLMHINTNGFCSNRLKVSASNQFYTDHSHVKQESFDRKTCLKTVSHISHQMEETKSQWLVTTCLLKHGYIPEIDFLASKLSFYPQVDAAFQIDDDRSLCNGRLSCFLPLPNNDSNKTGLPIHINACFGLTDNRRFIKWQEEDQKNDESAKWNELLIKYILPHVYLMMILDAIHLSRNSTLPAATVYNLWPDLSKTVHKDRWHEVATDTLKRLIEYKIFHLAKDEKIWVSPSDAVFPVNNICSDTMSAVSRLLITEGENLVTVPEHILKDVRKIFPENYTLTWVTPSYVRDVLHRSEAENLSKDDKYSLLELALSDEKYTDLQGLKLLPLSDGTFTSFSNEVQNTVLIDNEKFSRTLLPFCKERFIPNDLSHVCTMQLRKLATKNIYNIINLDAEDVVALIKKHLPMDWKVTQGHATWKTAENHHPPKSWLAEFWKFLSTEWNELNHFIDVPLIPLEPLQSSGNSVLLARLQSNTTLIFQSSTASSLSDHVQKVLRMVGCTVIKRDMCLRHHDIERYVLPASPRSVLQVFVNSHRDQVIKGIASASSQEKEELKVYLSSLDSLSNAEKILLSMLPIFRMMSGIYVAVQSKQAVVSTTKPAIPNDLPMPETIVKCANEADRRLLTLLNVELLDAAKLAVCLVDSIEAASFKKGEEQTVMTWILNNGSLLLSQSEQLLTKTKNLKFIETTHGEQKQVSDVFDPRNRTFQDLFEAELFPPPSYANNQEMLQSLKSLGLKTEQKEISTENILQVINHIEKLCVHSPDKAYKKAHTLVRVLNENDFLSKFTKAQIEELKQRQWVPCEKKKFLNGSICRNLKRVLYKPSEVRDSKYSSIVGYVMPLTSELTGHVCKNLGLHEPPPAGKVLENLSALRSMVNPNSDFQLKTELHSIYKFMQDNVRNFTDFMDTKSIPWIWNKSEFVCPGDIVLAYPPELDLSPYIKKVPEEFLQYENLLTKFGVKKTLSDEEIEDILHDIKQRIDCRYPPHGDLTERKVSIAILDWMRKNEKLLKDSTPVPVMAQNQNFTLQPLSKTVFCDISAEGLDDLIQDNEEFYVIHEEVLPITARWLKVPFLSTRILKPQFIQEQESFGIEQCGQSEPITQRIKNILKEYDEESDIFKELLQNAEDAGATTCKFLLDFRKHKDPPETLFDHGMALCNGPCLWIFNNEFFSQEDWRNIVKVGSASKEKKVEMIGKFGLGFNAVYHVSDIPSILSGKTLLILDPNVTHLEKHILSNGNPGIKLDPFQERLYKRFPGQLKSYEGIFDCDLSVQNSKKGYNGTLIKLPFRTQEEANKSEISSKVYDEERIRSFKNHLTDNSQTHLLFLKSITSMSLQIVPENASTPPWNDQIQTPLKISREVMNSFAVSNDTHLQEIEKTFRNSDIKCHNIIDVNKAHIVKIVQDNSDKSLTQYWLLYSCFGTHDSLQMFQRRTEQEHVFSFPIGGIAVPLHKEAKTNSWSPDESLKHEGQAFCFLPLSIETGLPVHVNGTFAVTSNRKSLWEKGVKSEWNKALLKDAVTSAYITTLLELKIMAQNGHIQNYSFHTFWPNTETVSKAFVPMVESFYSAVVKNVNGKSLEIFSNGHNWCSMDNVRFLNPKIEENRVIGDIAMKVFLSLGASYSNVVSLPSWVRQSFIDCGFESEIKQRTINWPEFYNIIFENLSSVDTHSRNTLVLNAIDLNDPAVDDLLQSYPCIPTQSCKKLQFIKRLVNPSGKMACLFELKEGRFLEGTENDFLSPKRIQRLSDLGMLNDRLPLEDIIERAEQISCVWQQDQSECRKRLQCLVESINDSSEDVNSLHWHTLSQIPFLPALVPLVQKNNKDTVLKKPSEVYSDSCLNLVSMTGFTVDHSNLQIHNYDPVIQKLRVLTNPPVETVLQQLLKAHQHCNAFEKTSLFNIAQSCYEYLNNYLFEQKDPNPIIKHAQSFPFIFIEDQFVNVRSVARSKEFEEKPYLYVLPVIFSKFERLWECLGVNKQFTKEQFVAALDEIKALNGSQPLSMSDLDTCVTILMKGLYKIKEEKLTNCLIPDKRGVLTPSKELRFNDSPWMPVSAGVKLAHDLIPRPVARHFGVMTTRHHTLKNHLVSEFSLHAKEFGQTEKLTVRIKNIIDAYPSKKDILKELIQNADDAEATEIHFVWDKRKHKTEKVFGKKWELVQGPALCVYNNKIFSDDDLQGIQQLGEGGKHEMFPLNSGTMFRLPLRTEKMAEKSEISRHAVTAHDMKELYSALTEDPEGLILFLKHITQIQFLEISEDGKEKKSSFVIEKKHTEKSMKVDKVWHEMIHEVYRSISQCDLPVIPTVHAVSVETALTAHHIASHAHHSASHRSLQKYTVTWCSPSKPHSENCPYFTSDDNGGIFEILDDTGMKLVPNLSKINEIKENFKSAGVNVTEVSASTVMNFLKQRSLNDPSQTTSGLPLPINQTWIKDKKRCSKLLSFCLTNADEKNVHDLNRLPLLLTEDQMLRVFDSKSPKLISRFSSLFQGHQEMFADSYVNISHVQILRERKFIKDLSIDIAAEYLKPELDQLLSQSLPDQRCQLYKAQTETIKWLKTLWSFFEDQEQSYQNENLNVFSEIKKHFNSSPILPVICPSQNNTHFLQTMGNVSKVIQYRDEKIASILIKLGFMKLDVSFFFDLKLEFRLKYMNPELLQTGDSSAVLGQVCDVPHSQFEALSKEECVDLQRFLQQGISDSNNKSQHVGMLKSLPLFESITGKRERIDLHRMAFILNSVHYNDFPSLYQVEGCDSIFLKHTWVNQELAEHLNIKILNDLEFCVQFILPSVHMMKEAKLLDLMRFLVELGTVDHRIVSALREVRFIRDIHGSLQVASYFYDDNVHLYRVMLPKERFVPETFWELFRDECAESKVWNNFHGKQTKAHRLLKDLGLKHEVSDEEIIQFAKQIESETRDNGPLDVLKERSNLLFRTVLSKSTDKNSELLERVSNIKFIFPVKIQQKLCVYHKAFAQEREVVAISGSLIDRDNDHHYLIWTSMPILPSELCSSHLIKKMTDAGALETPLPGQIAANLKNICTSQCHSDRLLETRETVFGKSYAYLQSINFDASLFSDLPIILVENGTKLVKAKQTALVLHDALDFRPYLYRIPSNYTKFEDFFKKICVKERPTINQYITVLQEIYSDSSDKESLQANQQITVKRVVQQLFCLLKEEQNKTSFQNDPLYLPSTDGRLYESITLFFNDTVFQPARLEGPLETKLKLLEKLNCCHLGNDHYEHQTLLQFLPQQVRPKFLSDVVSENLSGASVQYCDEEECEFSGWFDKHLSSAAFLHGLVCLIREDSKGGVSQSEAVGKCEEIFSKIQIICCKTLQTELLLNHEPLEGSKAETDVYVEKQQDRCSFYLKHNDDMVPKVVNEVNMCLTKEINALLKNCLTTSSFPVLGQLLLCDNMEDVEKTLAKHGIHNSGQEAGHDALPKPGCLIPEEWHDCLDMNFLNNFESGEYVGFSKDESGEYFYAIIINRLDDPLGQMRQFPARYKIQVGSDDFIEVSSLDLYQFKREKKATVSTGSTCTDIERLLTSRPPPKRVFPETFEEIRKEIDQSLNEIWNMSSEDKKKALKRLYLQWHPDKNPGNEELATEAFKYLQNRIEELQQGKTAHSTSSTWRDFRDFYDTWNTEARSHRKGRERFYQNYSRSHYNFWSYHRETPRPNRGEAKRWYEQAQCDISAAHNATGGDCSEWCLFKVHQAVEKSLIAAMYRRSGEHPNNCSITSLAQQVSHYSSQLTSLPNTVKQLTELGVDGKKTQYPNYHPFPHIPNKQFSSGNPTSDSQVNGTVLILRQYFDGESDLLICISAGHPYCT
ncbi:unnamed protein product [Leuciscus chuanchicus]